MTQQMRASIIVSTLTLITSLLLCFSVLKANDGDPLAFAATGTYFTNRTAAIADPHVTLGYDGQFVYYIARDGLAATPLIDGRSFRFQRIFLPVTARVLSLGKAELVPWVLLLINIFAHCAGAGLIAWMVAGYQSSGILGGLTYGLWIGMLMIVRLDLTEGLCFLLGMSAILTYQHQRYRWTIVLLIFSVLTKEMGLVFAAGLALHAWYKHQSGWAILIAGAPLLQLLTWWGVLWMLFHELPTIYPAARLQIIPFRGLVMVDLALPERLMLIMWLVIPTIVLFLLTLFKIWQERKITLSIALMLPAALFVFAIPASTWFDSVAAYRVAMPIVIAGLLFMAEHYPRRLFWLAAVWLPSLTILLLLPELWLGGV
jgi:hypothetical protein